MKTKAHTVYKLKDGTRVPGVTTITGQLDKPNLVEWANRLGLEGIDSQKYRDNTAEIGTLAHAKIIAKLQGRELTPAELADYTPNQQEQSDWACLSFWEWYRGHRLELAWAEQPRISEVNRFGGTVDIYGTTNGVREVIDLKTGSGIYPEHVLQVAGGYGQLLKDAQPCESPDRFRILNIPRTKNENWGEIVIAPDKVRVAQEMFLHMREVYSLRRQLNNQVVYAHKPKEEQG